MDMVTGAIGTNNILPNLRKIDMTGIQCKVISKKRKRNKSKGKK